MSEKRGEKKIRAGQKSRRAQETVMTKTTSKDEKITVSLEQILTAIKLIFARAQVNGLSEVSLGHDWYWHLDPDKAFELSEPPPEMTIGDLYDDAEVVRDIDDIQDGLIGLHLMHIASLLDFIGSEYPSLTPYPRPRSSVTET